MKIEFQRGANIHGPWWSTSVIELDPIPKGLIDLDMHQLQYAHLSEETRKNYLAGDVAQNVQHRMTMFRDHQFWLTASRDEVEWAIREALNFSIGDATWEVKL